jgi:hypothetical protein
MGEESNTKQSIFCTDLAAGRHLPAMPQRREVMELCTASIGLVHMRSRQPTAAEQPRYR